MRETADAPGHLFYVRNPERMVKGVLGFDTSRAPSIDSVVGPIVNSEIHCVVEEFASSEANPSGLVGSGHVEVLNETMSRICVIEKVETVEESWPV